MERQQKSIVENYSEKRDIHNIIFKENSLINEFKHIDVKEKNTIKIKIERNSEVNIFLSLSKKEYEENANQPYVIEAAGQLAEKLYGLDPDYDRNLPENKFLEAYKFSDDATRLINKDGHLIDVDNEGVERLINEDGRFIAYDEEGESYFVDRDGEKISEEGGYESEFTPFLDDEGKPVEVPSKEEEEETTEEEAVEAEETKPATKRRTTKRSTTKAKTE